MFEGVKFVDFVENSLVVLCVLQGLGVLILALIAQEVRRGGK